MMIGDFDVQILIKNKMYIKSSYYLKFVLKKNVWEKYL